MPSFGHAAWFGLGAYAARRSLRGRDAPMLLGLAAAPLLAGLVAAAVRLVRACGCRASISPCSRWPSRRSSGRSRSNGSRVTGGDNGMLGVWPARWARDAGGVLLAGARPLHRRRRCCCAGRSMRRSVTRCGRRAIRPRARRRSGSMRSALRMAGLRARRRRGGARRAALFAFAKGSVFPCYAGISALGRCAADGAARRRADAWPGRSSARSPIPASTTWLLRRPICGGWCSGWRSSLLVLAFPRGHRRGRAALRWRRRGVSGHDACSTCDGLRKVVRRRARGRRRILRRGGGRDAGPDRPERRRQVHLLQHAGRAAPPGCRARGTARARHRRPAAARDLPARRRPHLPGRRRPSPR